MWRTLTLRYLLPCSLLVPASQGGSSHLPGLHSLYTIPVLEGHVHWVAMKFQSSKSETPSHPSFHRSPLPKKKKKVSFSVGLSLWKRKGGRSNGDVKGSQSYLCILLTLVTDDCAEIQKTT